MYCTTIFFLWTLLMTTASRAKVIDLSHDHGPDSFMSPGNKHYKRRIVFSGLYVPRVFVEYGHISGGEHGGTHLDAPLHFTKGGKALHEIPLEHTILNGVMVDCSSDVNGNESYVMPLSKLHAWEKENGEIPKGSAVIINFGWSSRFENSSQYVGTDDLSNVPSYKYPSMSKEAGLWLARSRDTKLLAVDVMSPDMFKDNWSIHVEFLPQGRLIVENVKGPERLPPRGFRLHAAPVKFVGASGSVIRLYAITFEEDLQGNGGQRSSCLPASLFTVTGVLFAFQRFNGL